MTEQEMIREAIAVARQQRREKPVAALAVAIDKAAIGLLKAEGLRAARAERRKRIAKALETVDSLLEALKAAQTRQQRWAGRGDLFQDLKRRQDKAGFRPVAKSATCEGGDCFYAPIIMR